MDTLHIPPALIIIVGGIYLIMLLVLIKYIVESKVDEWRSKRKSKEPPKDE